MKRADVVDLLSHLVAIPSVNPSLVPGASGEGEIARFIAGWLADRGLQVDLDEPVPGRPNVVGRVPGHGGPALLLNAHIDTVGVAGMEAPWEPRVEGDRLYGRGAYDMKGGVAAVMLAAAEVAASGGAPGDVIVTAVMDEEYASLGTEAVLGLDAAAAVVTEPTGLRICTAHKGFAWLALETAGVAAHGSKPDKGVDAIVHMGRVLVQLERLSRSLAEGASHPLLGAPSVHASLIEGGQELSSYPERCRLQIERRTLPGETAEDVLREADGLLRAAAAGDERFRGSAELLFWREPFEVAPEEAVVRAVGAAAREVLGEAPAIYGDTPWMDAALLAGAGIPTVVFGPGGEGAHAAVEWASISQVQACAEILARVAVDGRYASKA